MRNIHFKKTRHGTKDEGPQQSSTGIESAMLDVNQVARLLNCSSRHVYRMADGGRMPRDLPPTIVPLVKLEFNAVETWAAGPVVEGRA
jgi:hypothetical protein